MNALSRWFAKLLGVSADNNAIHEPTNQTSDSERELVLETSPRFPMAVVYMYKHDRYYKIGRTKSPTKRNQ